MNQAQDAISLMEYRILAEFRYRILLFLRFSEQAVRTHGLEPQQYHLLLVLKGLPEGRKATISVLAARLQLQHHSTVELVNRLVERNFVQRNKDETDQRRVLVTLTPLGEQILQKLSSHHRTQLQSQGPALVQALHVLLAENASY